MGARKGEVSESKWDAVSAQFPVRRALMEMTSDKQLPHAMAFIYLRRMDDLGIPRGHGDLGRLKRAIAVGLETGHIRFPVSNRRLTKQGVTSIDFIARMQEPISDAEVERYEEIFETALSSAIQKVIGFTARAHKRFVAANGAEILEEHRSHKRAFLAALRDVWGACLDQFEVFVEIGREVGDSASTHIIEYGSDNVDNACRHEAMFRLYGRACQVADEISVLLANGFADGAQARWRSLHEIQVVMKLLSEGDESLSRRYLDHHDIDLYQEAKVTLACGGTRFGGISPEEFEELAKGRDELLRLYGRHFDAAYGWASELLGYKATRFSDLELMAEAAYIRPVYKAASANVHASSRGTQSRLGVPGDYDGTLAGASAHGLSHAAIGAAHSLVLAAVEMAGVAQSPDVMAKAMALQQFAQRLQDDFERAEQLALRPHRRPREVRTAGALAKMESMPAE